MRGWTMLSTALSKGRADRLAWTKSCFSAPNLDAVGKLHIVVAHVHAACMLSLMSCSHYEQVCPECCMAVEPRPSTL